MSTITMSWVFVAILAFISSSSIANGAETIPAIGISRVDGKSEQGPLGYVSDAVDCGSAAVEPRLNIPQCTRSPCSITKDTTYQTHVLVTISAPIQHLRFRATLIHSGTETTLINGVINDANLEQGVQYQINYDMSLAEIYEYLDAQLKIELLDATSERTEVCISAGVIVVEAEVTEKAYFDITIGGEEIGRVVIGLFGNVVPRTVRNFATICNEGINGMSYTGSIFHRVINRFMIQGGDIVNGDGTGQISIYGPSFEDENFNITHRGPGYLSMANAGPNTNGCQFFITTVTTAWLDGAHVVFGRVLQGQQFVHLIEQTATDGNNRPIQPVVVSACGAINL